MHLELVNNCQSYIDKKRENRKKEILDKHAYAKLKFHEKYMISEQFLNSKLRDQTSEFKQALGSFSHQQDWTKDISTIKNTQATNLNNKDFLDKIELAKSLNQNVDTYLTN